MLKIFVSLLMATMPLLSQATGEPSYEEVQQLDGAQGRQ